MRAFGPDEMILVASPELIAAHGEPRTLEDVARMPTLSMASADERSTWRFLGVDGEPAELTHTRRASARTISSRCGVRRCRDWRSPCPASPRCERSGGRRAHSTAAVAQGSRRSRARCFPVAARNGSAVRAPPRLPLGDCPPAPELARSAPRLRRSLGHSSVTSRQLNHGLARHGVADGCSATDLSEVLTNATNATALLRRSCAWMQAFFDQLLPRQKGSGSASG